MENINSLGSSGFVWWIGVVEDFADPLAAGRCRVRIFGWHTENKSQLPTEDLPWSVPLHPVNSSNSFSSPKIGDWIVGFYLDGENAQFPVMFGIIPFIKQ